MNPAPILSTPIRRLLGTPAAKRYHRGTHRSRTPAETLAVLTPHLRRFGITRVADVTGLDHLGIPVYMVVRPNSRSLAVSQGKGIDHDAAKVSGIMESLELYHAEFPACTVRLESYAVLSRQLPLADPAQLPGVRDSVFTADWPIPWTAGLDLMSGEPVWVPFELVHANTTVPPMPGSGCFDRGTNGLASGNTLAEAVLHGVCEVIERDALALWEHAGARERERTRLDLTTVEDPLVGGLLEAYEHARITVLCWDVTTNVQVPVYRVIIVDEDSDPVFNPMGGHFGAGCHADRTVALVRALTEAAQSRLTVIAGSRDDITRAAYHACQAAHSLEVYHGMARGAAGSARFDTTPSFVGESSADDVDWVLHRLADAGLPRVIAVDLSRPDLDMRVVRIVVPGLEGPTDSPAYRPGLRVRALAR